MFKSTDAAVYTDLSALAQLKLQAKNHDAAAIEKVAGQFESIFLGMVLKNMRQAKLADGIFDSQRSEFYRDMFDQQLALQLAGKPGIGLAKLITSQLSQQTNEIDEPKQLAAYRQQPVISGQKTTAKIAATADTIATTMLNESEPVFNDMSGDPQQFVTALRPLAEQAAAQLGVDAKVLLAQAALETGWGKYIIEQADGCSSHNLFNIKAGGSWSGKQTLIPALEYEQGRAYQEKAAFRVYDSFAESFNDYVSLIKHSPRYHQALRQAADPKAYLQALQQAGYATDPAYAEKVDKIVRSDVFADIEQS